MTDLQHVLAVGGFGSAERNVLADVAEQSALSLHIEADLANAGAWLDAHDAVALLVDGDEPDNCNFAVEQRALSKSAALPVLSWTRVVNDLSFGEAFAWGADDVVERSNPYALTTRLRHLPKGFRSVEMPHRGVALIADGDRNRRIVTGRVLRNAGYSITFAISGHDVEQFVQADNVELVVANSELLEAPLDMLERLRQAGSRALFIVNYPPRALKQARKSFTRLERATPTDGFAPAENVLFVSNELSRGFGVDKRTSPRLLFGTTTCFRGAGRESDDFGYSYNISHDGIYVRTLAPPDDDIVWLELCPPRSERRVRLVGRVAWRRGLSNSEFATVPPGFGVQIVDGAQMDLQAWRSCYRAFASVVGVSLAPAKTAT